MPADRFKFIVVPFLDAGLYLFFVALFSRNLADYDLWGYLSLSKSAPPALIFVGWREKPAI